MKNVTNTIEQILVVVCAVLYAILRLSLPFLRVLHSFLMILLTPIIVLLWLLLGLVAGDLGFPGPTEPNWIDDIETKNLESLKEEYAYDTDDLFSDR